MSDIETPHTNSIQKNYQDDLFSKMSQFIDSFGIQDVNYSPQQRTEDILNVLEDLLAITIFSISIDRETVRDASEASYVNIKNKALYLMQQELENNKNLQA